MRTNTVQNKAFDYYFGEGCEVINRPVVEGFSGSRSAFLRVTALRCAVL